MYPTFKLTSLTCPYNFLDIPVGTTVRLTTDHATHLVKVVEDDSSCHTCIFCEENSDNNFDNSPCSFLACGADSRKDGLMVTFRKVCE